MREDGPGQAGWSPLVGSHHFLVAGWPAPLVLRLRFQFFFISRFRLGQLAALSGMCVHFSTPF